MKLKKNKEDNGTWVLITLSTSHKTLGTNPADLHYKKPEYIDVDLNNLIKVIEDLEKKEIVSKSPVVGGNFCITKKGEKELDKKINELKTKKEEEYVSLISSVPIYELKERISTLEKIIFYSIIGGLFLVIATTQTPNQTPNSLEIYLKLISSVITIIFFIAASLHLTTLTLFASRGLKEKLRESIWRFIDKNYKIIFCILFLLLLSLLSIALNKYFGFDWKYIVGTIILEIIVIIIPNFKRILSRLFRIKEKMRNKIIKNGKS